MPTFEATHAGYGNLWNRATVTPARQAEVNRVAQRIISHRDQYEAVEKATGVPWFLIGCLHQRESGGDFKTHLHNGDSLSGFTHHVPAGRPNVGHGPPFTWEESAIDALEMRGLEKIKAWPIERILYESEGYNGWGSFNKGVNSSYVWGATNLQQRGKWVADHVWDANFWDAQPGVAAILKELAAVDPSIAARIATPAATPAVSTKGTTMTTTPAVTVTDPIPQIIAVLETTRKFLPMVAGFLPPPLGPALTAAIPIIEEMLNLVEDAKTKSGVDLFQAIGARIQTIGQHVQTASGVIAPAVAVIAPAAIAQQQPTG